MNGIHNDLCKKLIPPLNISAEEKKIWKKASKMMSDPIAGPIILNIMNIWYPVKKPGEEI